MQHGSQPILGDEIAVGRKTDILLAKKCKREKTECDRLMVHSLLFFHWLRRHCVRVFGPSRR